MTVKELIQELLGYDMSADIFIRTEGPQGTEERSAIFDLYHSQHKVYIQPDQYLINRDDSRFTISED